MKNLKHYFLTGLMVVVPLALTIYVLVVIFEFADNILGRYLNVYFKKTLGFYIPGLGFLFFVIIIIIVGFIASRFIGRKFLPFLQKCLSSMPLIRNIYPAFNQIIRFMLGQKEFGFKKVVLVEYPSKGIWSIGFLTNENFENINKTLNRDMVSVFVPNTPGPLAGYVIFIPREEIKFLDMSVSLAFKIIISGGVFKSEEKK